MNDIRKLGIGERMSEVIEKPIDNPTAGKTARMSSLPFIGNTLEMAKDPAKFLSATREYGPAYGQRVRAQADCHCRHEAAKLMTTRQGRECLRSGNSGVIWRHQNSDKLLTMLDGEEHQRLRPLCVTVFPARRWPGAITRSPALLTVPLPVTGLMAALFRSLRRSIMIVQVIGEIMAMSPSNMSRTSEQTFCSC